MNTLKNKIIVLTHRLADMTIREGARQDSLVDTKVIKAFKNNEVIENVWKDARVIIEELVINISIFYSHLGKLAYNIDLFARFIIYNVLAFRKRGYDQTAINTFLTDMITIYLEDVSKEKSNDS